MPPKSTSKQATSKPQRRQPRQSPEIELTKRIARVVGLLLLAAVSSPISQSNLTPIYGGIPSYFYHQKALTFTALVGFVSKDALRKLSPADPKPLLPVLAFWMPTIQLVLFRFSSYIGPQWGPFVTELLTYYPLLLLTAFSSAKLLETIDLRQYGQTMAELAPPAASYVLFSFSQKAFSFILPRIIGSNVLLTRVSLQLIVASAYAALAPSTLLALAVPSLGYTLLQNPHYISSRTTALLNETLHGYNYSLIERQDSLTGYVSVIESHDQKIQFMRCDHSLLGGEWLITPERKAQGQVSRETIYTVFTMLDAVRLVDTGEKKPEHNKSALIIGLGIGTSPKSMIAQGINTTILELDPAVHYFATKYFDLPPNHTAVIGNAIPYVGKHATSAPGSFDYIVHDVFTGGAEPANLFTFEFLHALYLLLTDKGSIAINYAGDSALASSNMVLNTVHAVFPACRIYRDNPPSEQPTGSDFVNMIIFCTKKAPSMFGRGITFRKPTEKDIGGSISKKHYLPPSPDLEIKFDWPQDQQLKAERKILTQENTQELEEQHSESALSHWRIMRTVIPDAVWELW